MAGPVNNFDLELYTDAAGSSGFGAFFQGKWSAALWPQSWIDAGFTRNLVLLELFPGSIGGVVVGHIFQGSESMVSWV